MRSLSVSVFISSFVIYGSMVLAADSPKVAVDKTKLPPVATKAGVTYASDIKPIFEQSCFRCHGDEKPKGRLKLNSLEAALKGGESGKVIEAGNSAESMLVHSIALLGNEEYFMPPPGNKAGIKPLSKEQVSLVRAWIDQGAK